MVFNYYHFFEILSLISAIVFFRYLKTYSLQLMLLIILLVCITELLASNCELIGLESNYIIYNIFLLLSTPLYFVVFGKIIRFKPVVKKVYVGIATGITIFSLVDLFYLEKGGMILHTITLSFLAQVVLSCILLAELAMEETRKVRMITEPYFWFAAGVMLYCLGTTVAVGLHSYILKHHLFLFGKPLNNILVPMLIVVLYSCYSIAFYLCRKHQTKLVRS